MYTAMIVRLLVAMVLAVGVTAVHRRLPPVLAARALATTVVAVGVAVVPSLWLIALAYLAHLRVVGTAVRWCSDALGAHDAVPAWAGVVALVLIAIGTRTAARVVRSYRRLRCHHASPVEVAENLQPLAFTLPGRGGQIVVSSGLLDLLTADERAVVLAHESAHARHRHDRYLLIAQLAGTIPLLRPLSTRLHYSVERWADEAAAAQCGDRRFVARTLGKVALARTPSGALGFGGLGVTGRVAALLGPPIQPPRTFLVAGMWLAIAAIGLLAAFDLHHLVSLLSALCPD